MITVSEESLALLDVGKQFLIMMLMMEIGNYDDEIMPTEFNYFNM